MQLPFPIYQFPTAHIRNSHITSFMPSTVFCFWARASRLDSISMQFALQRPTRTRLMQVVSLSTSLTLSPSLPLEIVYYVINCLFEMAIGHDAQSNTHTRRTGSIDFAPQSIDNNDTFSEAVNLFIICNYVGDKFHWRLNAGPASMNWLAPRKSTRKLTATFSECIYLLFKWPCTFIVAGAVAVAATTVLTTLIHVPSWIVLFMTISAADLFIISLREKRMCADWVSEWVEITSNRIKRK